ncbi:polysaccharide lyase family 7 protein [Glaciecola sp. MH2013]|uniref:polysaccharide lyase family 7 protein n=1 Tax=Glaciecola sp. MH2013 TaxID=2785524 RepID=UPI0018A07A12|nr:polysaccharide lyase family 7 protein [Glaciecola sp. MH2013]MBF7074297.1 polysaccharide lyase family 7 protein [Glaciecola sp. MH2013]
MYKISILTLALLLSACGSSDTRDIVLPSPDPEPEPETNVPEPLFPPDLSRTSCSGLDYLQINAISSDSSVNASFNADLAIDGSLDESSRWEVVSGSAEFIVDLGYRHYIREVGTAWYQGDSAVNSFDIAVSEDGETFSTILTSELTAGDTLMFERFNLGASVARFVKFTSNGDTTNGATALSEFALFGCPLDVVDAPINTQTVDIAQYGLDPTKPPGENFDLLSWALDTPRTDPDDGFSLRASERELDAGFEDDDYFYTADDGGMTFVATIFGAKTSANTSFTRSELREMLRRGNTGIRTQGTTLNNWVLGYQPEPDGAVAGRGGELKATLKVDKVTISGSQSHTGRVIVGQIHAGDDEPIRLYYKKFPDNERGYIYMAHEYWGGDDIWKTVLGRPNLSESSQPIYTDNPEQGIALGEIFSYEIIQAGSRIDVIIRRGDLQGPIIAHQYVDMEIEGSGYDRSDEWNYFKAGAYSQNNTGDSGNTNGLGSDFDQVTFYYLSNTHGEP